MAIVALQQMDAEARERGDPLFDDLQEMADRMYGATEMRGTGERHIRLLPTKPAFEVRTHCKTCNWMAASDENHFIIMAYLSCDA